MNCAKSRSFTAEEDSRLRSLVERHGANGWALIASMMGGRTPKECRERFSLHLSNYDESVPWSHEEETLLISLLEQYGKNWAKMAHTMAWRSKDEIKAHYYYLEGTTLDSRMNDLYILPQQKNKKTTKKAKGNILRQEVKIDPLLQLPWIKDPPTQILSDLSDNLCNFLRDMPSHASMITTSHLVD